MVKKTTTLMRVVRTEEGEGDTSYALKTELPLQDIVPVMDLLRQWIEQMKTEIEQGTFRAPSKLQAFKEHMASELNGVIDNEERERIANELLKTLEREINGR